MTTAIEVDPTPTERVRLVASSDGNQLASVEAGRVVIYELPALQPVAEIGIDASFVGGDVAFIGERGRLAMTSTTDTGMLMHVISLTESGPNKLGEIALRSGSRIAALADQFLLVAGPTGPALIDASRGELSAVPLSLRTAVTAAGRAGRGKFVLATAGVLEMWDASTRSPERRLRLERPTEIAHVGGNERRLWMIARGEPQRIDVVRFATKSTQRIDLPEAPIYVEGHHGGDRILVIGEATGTAYVVDVTSREPVLRLDVGALLGATWLGHGNTVALQPAGRALELLVVPHMADEARPAPRAVPAGSRPTAVAAPTPLAPPPPAATAATAPDDDEDDDDGPAAATPATPAGTSPSAAPTPIRATPPRPSTLGSNPQREIVAQQQVTREDLTERLAAWRKRVHEDPVTEGVVAFEASAAAVVAPVAPPAPSELAGRPHPGGWRADLAGWARAVLARSYRHPPTTDRGVLDDITERLELRGDLRHAIGLLYGAYLNGSDGVARIELAQALEWAWPEALGGGALAASDIVRWIGSRVALSDEALRAIDERPPRHGTIAGSPNTPATTAVAIVAGTAHDLHKLATWFAPRAGGLIVPNESGLRRPQRFMLEARMRRLAPVIRWSELGPALGDNPPRPGVIVVDDPETAKRLSLPIAAKAP